MRKLRNAQGFTMIELMVVLVIIGILALILVPQLMDNTTKAKFGEIPPALSSYGRAQMVYYHETNSVATDTANLSWSAPANSKWWSYVPSSADLLAKVGSTKVGTIDPTTEVAKCAINTSNAAATMMVASTYKKYLASFTPY